MRRLQLRLARNLPCASWLSSIAVWFAVAGLLGSGTGCSKAPPTDAASAQANLKHATDVATTVDLDATLGTLLQQYGDDELETMLDALPVLQPYFDDEQITSGMLAAHAHWNGLSPGEQAQFAGCLGQIMDDMAQMQALTASLPNGFHDVGFALPPSRALYESRLEQYGLSLSTATSNDIASSLSTYDNTAMAVAVAAMLCEMSGSERNQYLHAFARMADEINPRR